MVQPRTPAQDRRPVEPARRWAAAVATRPLEAPLPLPARFHALARAITGRSAAPRFTTGPATRHALAAAGALGATTGSVIHLARLPAGEPGTTIPPGERAAATVLAHELAHVRHPVRRPRFLLARSAGAVDDDERAAAAAGNLLFGGSRPGPPAGRGAGAVNRLPVGAGIVDGLPVRAGGGSVVEVAVRAARAVLVEAGVPEPAADTEPAPPGPAVSPGPAPVDTGTAANATAPAGAVAQPQPGAGHGVPLDADRVVEIVEERLLREIERRGGQWAGVF
jgi:Domain of unknown function (DUF4157)